MNTFPARLILARHGETEWNNARIPQGQVDIPLNEAGRRQAHALALRLQDWTIDAIYSSDLARAAETAAIVGLRLGLVPTLAPVWREMDLGNWVGLTRTEIQTRFPDQLRALELGEDVRRGGGENQAELLARAGLGFEQLRTQHAGQSVLIISHGGTIRSLIGYLIGLEATRLNRLAPRGNTSLSVVEFTANRPQLVLLNDSCHLNGLNSS